MPIVSAEDEELMSKIICKCKKVSEYEILFSIRNQNAKVWGDIQRITGASTGCGRCGSTVQRILASELEKQEQE